MVYSISNGRLRKNAKPVDFIRSIYGGGPFAKHPTIAIIHFTYGGTARSSAEWFRTKRPKGSSAHVIIERDGSVIQCVPFDRVAWHAGDSRWREMVGLNNHSFGIELANWGYLKQAGEGWSCWTGKRVDNVMLAIHKNGNPDRLKDKIGWELYPEAQYASASAIVSALAEAYGVDEILGHDDIAPTRKWDPGPAFDMDTFRARVFGGRGDGGDIRMKVAVQHGLNLRAGAAISFPTIELLPIGTVVEPMASEGMWLEVSVLGQDGKPRASGWVHRRYLSL